MQVQDDVEVLKDPRKIFYKSNEELKRGLVGLNLAVALTKNFSRKIYTKEFFENNIRIESKRSGHKEINFGVIDRELLDGVLNENLIFEWMVYSDNQGRKLLGLADYKGVDLENDESFRRGGSPEYEFARFERKCYKDFRKRVQSQKDDMQNAFRRVFAETAAKQLTEKVDPLEFTARLFSSNDPAEEIANLLKSLGEKSETIEIEYKEKKNN
jgi:hypothetical protein